MPEHEAYRVIVSKRAAQQLVEHAAFAARLDEKLAHKLVSDFRQAADSLKKFPFRNPVMRSEVFTVEKYRKLIFDKYHILLYQIKGQVVYVEYVIDGRQDYQWLLTP
jgi:plasmid stabilization system protein ParE